MKREQNLGEADPTILTRQPSAYKVNAWSKVFFTQRLTSAQSCRLATFRKPGLLAVASRITRRETKFGKNTSMVEHQIENGISGNNAVIGLQNRLPIAKAVAGAGIRAWFHLSTPGHFNAATLGFGWTPD